MLDTRAPMGMHPASISISARQTRIFKGIGFHDGDGARVPENPRVRGGALP
jgi:hypothetical protein